MRSSQFWKSAYDSDFEPHWAIQIFLDPREELALVNSDLYPNVSQEQALGQFDIQVPGWVPRWFPRIIVTDDSVIQLTPEQRLDWFDKALANYAQSEWPPTGSLNSKQQSVALSLLYMLAAQEYSEIPPPDKIV